MNPIFFAVGAALAYGFLATFHKLAAPHINQIFGAMMISFTALTAGALILFGSMQHPSPLLTHPRAFLFVILAGIAAFCVDFFALRAYARGLPVSIGAPIIIGGGIALAVVIGLFLGESLTWLKGIGLVMLIAGATVLAALAR